MKHECEEHKNFDTKKTKPDIQIEENTNEGSSKAKRGFLLEFDIKKMMKKPASDIIPMMENSKLVQKPQ